MTKLRLVFVMLLAFAPDTVSQNIEDIPLYESEEARQKVKSYTHGNYLYDLVNFVYFLVLLGIFTFGGFSARLRDYCARMFKRRTLVVFFYWLIFFALLTLFTFPLDYYRQFYREHQYGFSQETFPEWIGDYGKQFAIGVLFGGIFFVVLYWVFRRTPKNWWMWGAAISVFFVILSTALVPEFIAPLFNKYEPIKDAELRGQVLQLAACHGIHPEDVFQVDTSKQSTKISAFVFGLLGTQRIVLTDTLLQRCTTEEILVVVGHEMGHYLLNHIWKGIAIFTVVVFIFGFLLQWIFRKITGKYEARLGFREVSDVAGLPLLIMIFTLLFFLFSPLFNTYSRHIEAEADWYGLTATGFWEAEIAVDKKLGEYREMDPHPLIEFLLFDHPSGKNRIKMALQYRDRHKAGNKTGD